MDGREGLYSLEMPLGLVFSAPFVNVTPSIQVGLSVLFSCNL